ncbi:MAG: hypothetical protein C4519_17370 [Desulfobacteraceae bacterium]|nr:MAG: hypothetical protein C4519_17370 [Desulfobacteraceae bacterium]
MRANWLQNWTCCGILVAIALFRAAPAQAHKVTIFAWAENDTIHTESKFSAGKPVQGGKIEVYDPQGKKLVAGITDDQGRFNFRIPQRSDLKIVLTAGMGHGNHWWLRAQAINPQAEIGAPPVARLPSFSESATHPDVPPNASECLDAQAMQQIVAQALEKRLGPLEARLAEQPWDWRDIIAGIGYILGLMGVAVLVRHGKIKEKR